MADFRVTISDSKSKLAYQVAVTGPAANKIIGKKIGDVVSGDIANMAGYTLKVTGGTDKDGFAMRGDLPGPARRKILVAGGVGYIPKADGVKKRKSMRGNEISSEISQINTVILEYGQKPLNEIFVKKEGEEAKKEKERPKGRR
ncbi:MAG: 30S ribosomal protein S6e [Candidatus Methanoperedens sp.]|uniref:30S ribosomal protein S6e n=1 Tax=Candidatus Methanoperedens sp. BLZ2 TaxID=2035255 RepID=UPI000BE3244F|nr:30S ribosomal protein S6e [Candidatus Methanoperedens sp. BLZ2]KAB2942710.1 MAG: 30S ribosomal protein S6e [Candidatus Methanoperedens sp.]MBZ0175349.1 30S ribosomal protein S6e [Candidatus Methanoperedens nitroreducens]MCX9079491.1 30S ribosomal protein S6e [Candidatus Methanoperedens sp.]MCX9089341.1 30S ribosomal protein S6e [Candidatus Methanoperedens sp.]